jgi:hypothetical protein
VSATSTINTNIETQSITTGEQVDEKDVSGSEQDRSMSAWKQRITGILPVVASSRLKKSRSEQESVPVPSSTDTKETIDIAPQNETTITWFEQLQRLILGQQQYTILSAALIESPIRVQPNQVFTLRLHILGRDETTLAPGTDEVDRSTGLSSLVYGDTFSIEVHTVINQNDAYVMQQATVTIPAAGSIAEVTIPIQLLNILERGRRDRLHIFFFDQQRHPLYEKPFVLEVFVSHLVKRGHEGHHVLTIPR